MTTTQNTKTFTFHSAAGTIATVAGLAEANAFANKLAPTVKRGTVSVTMPQGGELALSSFGPWSGGALRALARNAA